MDPVVHNVAEACRKLETPSWGDLAAALRAIGECVNADAAEVLEHAAVDLEVSNLPAI